MNPFQVILVPEAQADIRRLDPSLQTRIPLPLSQLPRLFLQKREQQLQVGKAVAARWCGGSRGKPARRGLGPVLGLPELVAQVCQNLHLLWYRCGRTGNRFPPGNRGPSKIKDPASLSYSHASDPSKGTNRSHIVVLVPSFEYDFSRT